MKKTKYALSCFISLVMFTCVTGQINVLSSNLVFSDDSAILTMQFRVEKGFYVIAPDDINADGTGFPMKITWVAIPDRIKPVNKVIWPASNLHGHNAVYTEGDYTVKQVFAVLRNIKKTPAFLEGKIAFQGCQEDRCYPPDEIHFKTALLENGDSAWARLEKLGGDQLPPGKEAWQKYMQLRPLGKKKFEDQHLLMRMTLAGEFWQNYPQHTKRQDAMRIFLSADPYFIAESGNDSLDSIEKRPGLDWSAMLRSAMIDTAAREKWLASGETIVNSVLNGNSTQIEKEQAAFSLFARDFRLAARNFDMLPRKASEHYYWLSFERDYWNSFSQRFQKHILNYAELPILQNRAKDFLSALKGRSPAMAIAIWNELQEQTANAHKKGLKLVHETATEQMQALKIERGEETLSMSFTALDKSEFQLENYVAKWC